MRASLAMGRRGVQETCSTTTTQRRENVTHLCTEDVEEMITALSQAHCVFKCVTLLVRKGGRIIERRVVGGGGGGGGGELGEGGGGEGEMKGGRDGGR